MHPPSTARHGRAARLAPLLLTGLVASSACRSAEEHAANADRQVYEIVRNRLETIGDEALPFTIDPPPDSLRARILEAEVEGVAPELPELKLVDSLEIGAENSREYQDQREALYLVALALTLELWNFQLQESGTLGALLGGDGGGAEEAVLDGDVGFTKLFSTGAFILGNIGIDFVRDVSSGDGWDAIGSFSLNITQPLLRGFGREIVLEPLTQAQRDVLYEARTYERFRRVFAFNVSTRFFRILQAYDTLANEIANYERRKNLRERNEAFALAGRLNEIEVDQARQDELLAENRVVLAQQTLEQLLDNFNLFLGLPPETTLALDPEGYKELESWDVLKLEFTEQEAIATALVERLDLMNTLDRVVDAERKVVVAENALEAGLDLAVGLAGTSQDGSPLDYRSSDILWDVSLNFDAPVNQLPERNAYRATLITLQRTIRRAEGDTDDIVAEVRDDLRLLRTARETLDIQQNAEVLAQRRVDSTQLNLEAGRADTRDVLESQDALVQAQNALVVARTEYILAGIALYLNMGLLRVDEEGIDVDILPIQSMMEEVEAP